MQHIVDPNYDHEAISLNSISTASSQRSRRSETLRRVGSHVASGSWRMLRPLSKRLRSSAALTDTESRDMDQQMISFDVSCLSDRRY